MNNRTVITTGYDRKLTIRDHGHSFNLHVKDTDGTFAQPGEVYTSLTPEEATKLANALLGGNATVVTDLPKVEKSGGYLFAGNYSRSITNSAEEVLENAKALLAIHAFLVEQEQEQAEADAREKRRDELTTELGAAPYGTLSVIAQKAIDRIIDLEEAAKV